MRGAANSVPQRSVRATVISLPYFVIDRQLSPRPVIKIFTSIEKSGLTLYNHVQSEGI